MSVKNVEIYFWTGGWNVTVVMIILSLSGIPLISSWILERILALSSRFESPQLRRKSLSHCSSRLISANHGAVPIEISYERPIRLCQKQSMLIILNWWLDFPRLSPLLPSRGHQFYSAHVATIYVQKREPFCRIFLVLSVAIFPCIWKQRHYSSRHVENSTYGHPLLLLQVSACRICRNIHIRSWDKS